jgi:hypothetical protein
MNQLFRSMPFVDGEIPDTMSWRQVRTEPCASVLHIIAGGLTMKKLAKLKIKLNPETIRDLTAREIGQVVGGLETSQPSNGTGCKTCG